MGGRCSPWANSAWHEVPIGPMAARPCPAVPGLGHAERAFWPSIIVTAAKLSDYGSVATEADSGRSTLLGR